MKKNLLSLLLSFAISQLTVVAQNITFLGEPLTHDNAWDVLYTSDGGFIIAGSRGDKGILYKVDCGGNVVAEIEKSLGASLAFRESVELPDGSIVAVGTARNVPSPADTLPRVALLKTDLDLNELAFNNFTILNKRSSGKSIALAQDGSLLVVGDVEGTGVDFTDMFFQRANPFTLSPTATPVIYSNGVDEAVQITPTNEGDSLFLVTSSSLVGFLFDPEAVTLNQLVTRMVDAQGVQRWQYIYSNNYKNRYGNCRASGAAMHSATGNIMTAGVIYSGASDFMVDPIFVLLNDEGEALDTVAVFLPDKQQFFKMIPNPVDAGAHFIVGQSQKQSQPPTLLLFNPKEFNGQIVTAFYADDTATPISLRDISELPVNRFAFVGTLPGNPLDLSVTDIIAATPELENIEIAYQNCALTASFSAPDPSYQWYLNGAPIPGANTGFYFPAEAGLYQVQITDAVGCFGTSDTLPVTFAEADFGFSTNHLTATFTNNSTGATLYSWNFGDNSPVSTQPNPTHTYTTGGPYTVTLIASGPCNADTMVQTIGIVDIDDPAWLEHFRLFPNPNAGIFTVEINGEPQGGLVCTLFNATGQTVGRQIVSFETGTLRHTFDFGFLTPGLYHLQIQGEAGAKYVTVAIR